jgi:hypothetical protein
MYAHSSKLVVSNSHQKPQVVVVDPWGEDYSLLPGEECEIVAYGDAAGPSFHIVVRDGTSQVYCIDANDFQVLQNGAKLECGHNRQ